MADSQPSLVLRIGLSFLGTGYIGKGGGTLASAVAAIGCFFLWPYPLISSILLFVLLVFGIWACSYVQPRGVRRARRARRGRRAEGWEHDDSRITIDEVCGMLAASILLPRPPTLWGALLVLGLAFFLFRLLDIFKPPPVSFMERLPGGWGVMGDDIVAGIIANGVVQLVRLLPQGWLGGQ